jgi:hypothetical protein
MRDTDNGYGSGYDGGYGCGGYGGCDGSGYGGCDGCDGYGGGTEDEDA